MIYAPNGKRSAAFLIDLIICLLISDVLIYIVSYINEAILYIPTIRNNLTPEKVQAYWTEVVCATSIFVNWHTSFYAKALLYLPPSVKD